MMSSKVAFSHLGAFVTLPCADTAATVSEMKGLSEVLYREFVHSSACLRLELVQASNAVLESRPPRCLVYFAVPFRLIHAERGS